MLEQYQEWNTIEQETVQAVIRKLLSQTFLLERKYDKKSGRMASDREYEFCADHLEFLTEYFAVAGITIRQNYELGIIYIRGAEGAGERLTKLTTLYLLLLKLIYDEKMAAVSSSIQAFTTVGELNGKLGEFRLVRGLPSITEQKRAFAALKKYQMVELLDGLEEMGEACRILIYPSVNLALLREDAGELVKTFEETEEESEDGAADTGL